MRRLALFLLVASSCLATAASADGIDSPATFEKVTAYLKAHPEVRSIDALLPALPADFRSNFTLMHHSNSLQTATPEKPRAILYGADARFIVAFASDPKDSRYDSLETIQFRDDKNTFEFHEIIFPEEDATKQVEVTEANPALCLKCHYADPRPNWEHYSEWPGAFGEDDDQNRFAQNADLAKRVEDFLKTAESQPRFRHIPDLAKSYERDPVDSFRTRLTHNINFTQRAAQLNFRRLTRLMAASPQYRFFKYAALAATLDCSSLDQYLTEAAKKAAPELDRTHYQGGPEGAQNFFTALGTDTKSWSMDFVNERRGFTTPGNYYSEFIAAVGGGDADYQPYVTIRREQYAGIPWLLGSAQSNACHDLVQKSLDALGGLSTP